MYIYTLAHIHTCINLDHLILHAMLLLQQLKYKNN